MRNSARRRALEFDVRKIVADWLDIITEVAQGHDYGQIDKKFAGIAKEFLTTADNYVVRLDHHSLNENQQKILSSVSCVIDLIFKEYN